MSGGYSFDQSESAHAETAHHPLPPPPSTAIVVFQSQSTPVTDPAYQQEQRLRTSRVSTFAHVTGVTQAALAKMANDADHRHLQRDLDHAERMSRLQADTADARAARQSLPEGQPRIYGEYIDHQYDAEHSESFAASRPVVLLVVFGTLIAALMPLILALVAVPVALAIIFAIAAHNG